MRIFIIFTIIIICTHSLNTAAADEVKQKRAEITTLDQQLAEIQKERKNIKGNLKGIERDLKKVRKSLIKTAESIQENELKLQNLDAHIQELQTEKDQIEAELEKDRGSIATLILAMERIQRLPPEALIVQHEAPYKTAQSAMLLQQIVPALNQQAENLRKNLKRLNQIDTELTAKRETLAESAAILAAAHESLNEMLEQRKALFASTQDDLKSKEQTAKNIAQKSNDLQDLVKKLEAQRKKDEEKRLIAIREAKEKEKAAKLALAESASKLMREKAKRALKHSEQTRTRMAKPATPPSAGEPRLPLSGSIKTAFHQRDHFGGLSQGIDIEGRAGALVVAPMGGIVQFAGFFKNYGNIVILEHQNGYHSLIGGLQGIDTVVGQSVNAGEPVGELHKSSNRQNPVLYYELRQHGKPINPAKKFGNLS